VIESAIFLRWLAQQCRPQGNKIWHKGSRGWGWCWNFYFVEYILRKHTIPPHSMMQNMTHVVMTFMQLCIQSEAFASNLGDDQSHYLYV